jgi:hypothetical protein
MSSYSPVPFVVFRPSILPTKNWPKRTEIAKYYTDFGCGNLCSHLIKM